MILVLLIGLPVVLLGMLCLIAGFFLGRRHYAWWEDQKYKSAIRMAMEKPFATDKEIVDWCNKNIHLMPMFEQFREERD